MKVEMPAKLLRQRKNRDKGREECIGLPKKMQKVHKAKVSMVPAVPSNADVLTQHKGEWHIMRMQNRIAEVEAVEMVDDIHVPSFTLVMAGGQVQI